MEPDPMSDTTAPDSTSREGDAVDRGESAVVSLGARTAQVDAPARSTQAVFELEDLGVLYGGKQAVQDVTVDLYEHEITAFIGPSGCGKSTILRCLNRMNDLVPSARVEGSIRYHGQDLYDSKVDSVEVRKRIGMVFQKPNPFPKSIFDNVAFGPKVLGMKGDMDEIVERALRRAALWDEVKDRLKTNAFGMSGGQQQRLCIARCLAVDPDVILMDEPCSALDPISTGKIEDLMIELFIVDLSAGEGNRIGRLVEFDATAKIFTNPADSRTEDYVTGKVG